MRRRREYGISYNSFSGFRMSRIFAVLCGSYYKLLFRVAGSDIQCYAGNLVSARFIQPVGRHVLGFGIGSIFVRQSAGRIIREELSEDESSVLYKERSS